MTSLRCKVNSENLNKKHTLYLFQWTIVKSKLMPKKITMNKILRFCRRMDPVLHNSLSSSLCYFVSPTSSLTHMLTASPNSYSWWTLHLSLTHTPLHTTSPFNSIWGHTHSAPFLDHILPVWCSILSSWVCLIF